ncbi:uncharacterized protein LOC106131362 [Amyelois transitella]|uniref:uncharacterized protein LOC106131362 n=1 Tax=Amyelois transitella TaxID=680683 RepID=UPI00067ABA2D|nr:uncharacterized protein LOC106131362 [Amyelois transitella]XP_013185906.1 uncharacterized protein LOC106131362 [Amyelois transitella]XP_013185907.1 uncharacterized protein LOC106131362 [Amyelois transitella]XP_060800816.1 uncharacterized protein LOC106131362 [Amyelois transitella]XP_060800817.1 uncharacterized protein LOC106131362 [Amyelois transitella]
MEQDVKVVFSSEITRGTCGEKNNLYELLNVDPAKPVQLNEVSKPCTFQSKNNKCYEYKKKSKLKVNTVKDIRKLLEKDVEAYLPQNLEKQQNMLLKQIRNGYAKNEETKKLARNILKSDNPILRTAWQMLTNINPEENTYPVQYILWNGKNIRICGSRGGYHKYIYKFEVHNSKYQSKNKKSIKKTLDNRNKCLLQNSLSLKIKPGPLTQKKFIDDSYQKHHVGNLDLVYLPRPGLDVMPVYGSSMEPSIRNFVNSLRNVDGTISQKWAEFAVSMVGTINKSHVVQQQPLACTTFELNYKYDQKKMLMRRDIENIVEKSNVKSEKSLLLVNEDDVLEEVGKVLCDIIDAVEISFNQDKIYTGEDEVRNNNEDISNQISEKSTSNYPKDKKKKFCELDRLDVTVIRLPENSENCKSKHKLCKNTFCQLGCICDSLNSTVIVKEHCGRLECMFQCKCDFSNYKDLDKYGSVSSDLIPGLLKIDKEINNKLSKEEKKFHQTVVLSGDKSIILKSHKRHWKASSKYSDFYKTMSLKMNKKIDRNLIVVATNINCDNIEPWCMVHNLYKCFCKGRFIHSAMDSEGKNFEAPVGVAVDCEKIINTESAKSNPSYMHTRPQREKPLWKSEKKERRKSDKLLSESYSIPVNLVGPTQQVDYKSSCARSQAYVGRKYSQKYYRHMNSKIREMEEDDLGLHNKLKSLVSIDVVDTYNFDTTYPQDSDSMSRKNKCQLKNKMDEETNQPNKKKKTSSLQFSNVAAVPAKACKSTSREETPELNADHIRENMLSGRLTTTNVEESNKSKLVAWLEYSYKQYKKRVDLGLTKLTLQAPQSKKMALLPWNFILERYKERKNLFLVSKQKPFRMFMAVNRDHPFLQECVNIDDIRFADLNIYPITVKKLITNATDLKDSFCILCGHPYCWELIGSVTKVDESNNEDGLKYDASICTENSLDYCEIYNENENSRSESDPPISSDDDTLSDTQKKRVNTEEVDTKKNYNESESSKWFVMTVEKDFSEIQFYNKGFFVKYDSIIKAINIARYSKKTVRLSSQKCAENSNNSQFGIYAIPNSNEDSVFIGPYECDESLGIETIRSITHTRRTRGYWITTNKVDNRNVIDNPMSFMPPENEKPSKILSLKSKPNEKKDSFSYNEDEENIVNRLSPIKKLLLNPIKIKKINNFYSLSNSFLGQPTTQVMETNQIEQSNTLDNENTILDTKLACNTTSVSITDLLIKLNAQMTDETNEKSTSNLDQSLLKKLNSDSKDVSAKNDVDKLTGDTKPEDGKGGFAILKPEEINRRIMNTNIFFKPDDPLDEENSVGISQNTDSQVEKDIETLLTTPLKSIQDTNMDVLVISDDDENCTDEKSDAPTITAIWIESRNVNLGWIEGLLNNRDNQICFQFPGFQYSSYYPKQTAFEKINQILSRRIFIPVKIKIEWHILTQASDLRVSRKLQLSDLGRDRVLTKSGIRDKRNFLMTVPSLVKTYSRKSKTAESLSDEEKVVPVNENSSESISEDCETD